MYRSCFVHVSAHSVVFMKLRSSARKCGATERALARKLLWGGVPQVCSYVLSQVCSEGVTEVYSGTTYKIIEIIEFRPITSFVYEKQKFQKYKLI